ncbi:hypothetical protein C8R43DRAFT_1234503 [Mycena crocata]|nr:hypothetical protein C8R43DRAFT_1234503 [Mycena crocata]
MLSARMLSRRLKLASLTRNASGVLFDPNFLDQLIPPAALPVNPPPPQFNMMNALRQFSHRTRTANEAPAYASTLSVTLDAFQQLTGYSYGKKVGILLDKIQYAPNLVKRTVLRTGIGRILELKLASAPAAAARHGGNLEARKTLLWSMSLAPNRLLYHAKDTFPMLRFPSALHTHLALDSAEATEMMHSYYRRWFPLAYAGGLTRDIDVHNNTAHFFKRDPERFQKYLISVEKGQRTISGATLLPHELVAQICRLSNTGGDRSPELKKHRLKVAAVQLRVVEAQWKTLARWRFATSLAVSLSLLLAQLTKPPFDGGFIPFSENPQFVRLDPAKSLYETVIGIEQADWGMNTDINAVFLRLILPLAIEHKVKLSESEESNRWDTNYDVIERAFAKAEYEIPQIVYWNLSNQLQHTSEVLAERRGVAMMSGFSPSLLKVFMGEEGPTAEERGASGEIKAKPEFNPLNIMKAALARWRGRATLAY